LLGLIVSSMVGRTSGAEGLGAARSCMKRYVERQLNIRIINKVGRRAARSVTETGFILRG
jgi:hypothetical protein